MTKVTLLEFPCDFPVKIVGRADEEFEPLVLTIVERHAPDFDRARASSRLSSDGNFISVTCTILARNQAQLDMLYQELSDHERVLMAL
jgi:putative lipoic acid-binding regulatory protein